MESAEAFPDFLPPDFLLDMDYDELIPVDNFFASYLDTLAKDKPYGNEVGGSQPSIPPPATGTDVGQAAINNVQFSPAKAYDAALPPATGQAAPAYSQGPLENSGSDATTGDASAGRRGDSVRPSTSKILDGGISKMSKSERQQMLNKAAQQRYRERKKEKAAKLEDAVQSLQNQVEQLNILRGEKSALQEKVLRLERELYAKDLELGRLRYEAQLSGRRTTEIDPVTGGSKDMANELAIFVEAFSGCVDDLRNFLEVHQLTEDNGPVTVDNLSADVVAALKAKNDATLQNCVKIHLLSTEVDTWAMIESRIDKVRERLQGGEDQWYSLVERLHLTPASVAKALSLRDVYLAKLETIYIDRQQLNLMAVRVLLPEDAGGSQPGTRATWFSFKGFFKRHKHTNKVASVMGRLKLNLVEEQKVLSELDVMVMARLLDPLQCSKAIVATFPHHCEATSLLNAIWHVHGSQK